MRVGYRSIVFRLDYCTFLSLIDVVLVAVVVLFCCVHNIQYLCYFSFFTTFNSSDISLWSLDSFTFLALRFFLELFSAGIDEKHVTFSFLSSFLSFLFFFSIKIEKEDARVGRALVERGIEVGGGGRGVGNQTKNEENNIKSTKTMMMTMMARLRRRI